MGGRCSGQQQQLGGWVNSIWSQSSDGAQLQLQTPSSTLKVCGREKRILRVRRQLRRNEGSLRGGCETEVGCTKEIKTAQGMGGGGGVTTDRLEETFHQPQPELHIRSGLELHQPHTVLQTGRESSPSNHILLSSHHVLAVFGFSNTFQCTDFLPPSSKEWWDAGVRAG